VNYDGKTFDSIIEKKQRNLLAHEREEVLPLASFSTKFSSGMDSYGNFL
jgi:hypothetical protein